MRTLGLFALVVIVGTLAVAQEAVPPPMPPGGAPVGPVGALGVPGGMPPPSQPAKAFQVELTVDFVWDPQRLEWG